jgi:hypothetical protein
MSFIDTIDDAMHAACTKFSHRLQQFCGLTNYFVARIGVALTAICIIASVINYFYQFLPEKSSFLLVVLGGLILISCVSRSIACQKGEDSIGDNVKPAHVLFYQERPLWRVVWVGFAIMDFCFSFMHHPWILALIQTWFFSLGCALFYNFIIVNPLPPGKNKVKEWLNSFGRQPVPVPVQNS